MTTTIRRSTVAMAVAAVSMIVLTACMPAGPPPKYTNAIVSVAGEKTIHQRYMGFRAYFGQSKPQLHGQLTDKARKWSTYMAGGGCPGGAKLCHSQLKNGITVSWKQLAENVGFGPTVNGIFSAFEKSPGHLKNLWGPWHYYGVGVVAKGGYYYVTMVFMRV